jgi:Flp pilus assembly pilin Flp
MILRTMDKLFALQPRASLVEYGVIAAIITTAVCATLLALAEPISAVYSSVIAALPSVN